MNAMKKGTTGQAKETNKDDAQVEKVVQGHPDPEIISSDEKMEEAIYGEIGDLAKTLNGMVGKIQTAESVIESVSTELPFGTDQLSDVNRKTEEATQKILDDTDKVNDNNDLMLVRLESLKATLFDESLQSQEKVKGDIQALCRLLSENKNTMFNMVGTLSFQDPAGQQIRKVTAMLELLQARVLKMVVTFGKKARGTEIPEARKEELLTELEYSSEGERIEQDLVDTVLSEYGF
ncbi:MAG: protein phosphatase CheZ [Nitrospiria bacterium]